MPNPYRRVEPYDPVAQLKVRHPDWSVRLTDLGEIDEVFDLPRRVILINPRGDERWALAHAAAHLELEHVNTGTGAFSARQEDDADWVARICLEL